MTKVYSNPCPNIDGITKAIFESNLGLTPNNDGETVRLNIPALTQERRTELTKVVKKAAECINKEWADKTEYIMHGRLGFSGGQKVSSRFGNVKIAEYLLKAGADVNCRTTSVSSSCSQNGRSCSIRCNKLHCILLVCNTCDFISINARC